MILLISASGGVGITAINHHARPSEKLFLKIKCSHSFIMICKIILLRRSYCKTGNVGDL
jgi:hypothetical protein